MKKFFYLLFLFIVTALSYSTAQHEGFIYGKVILLNGGQYTGKIYWSAGQRMWTDLLVVEKKDNPLLKYLNNDELRRLSEEEKRKQMDWGFMSLWENRYPSRKLTLRCRFGDIAAIEVTGSREAVLVLKNGEKMNVYIDDDREYRKQLGEKIGLYTSKREKIRIEWEKIAEIRFMRTPYRLSQFDAVPLYGTVSTRLGLSYTGLVQWDMDEHHSSNYVHGETREEKDIRFRFGDVQSIRPKDEGALVKLHSGKEIYLQGNSDVSRSNRGIVVRHPSWGQVTIRWKDFKEVVFKPLPREPGFGYNDFPRASVLKGSVRTTDHKTWKGEIVYELDEKLDIETIDGWDKAGALRQVPLRSVKKVYPVSEEQAAIVLKDGAKLILGDRSDVSEKNWGVLVKLQGEEFKYIPWNKVDLITFD